MILFKKVPDFAFNDHEIVGIRCCCQIVLLVVVLLNLAASIFFNGNWFRNRSKQSLNFILWTLLKYFHILDGSRTLNAYVSYNTTRIHNIWQKRLQSHFRASITLYSPLLGSFAWDFIILDQKKYERSNTRIISCLRLHQWCTFNMIDQFAIRWFFNVFMIFLGYRICYNKKKPSRR